MLQIHVALLIIKCFDLMDDYQVFFIFWNIHVAIYTNLFYSLIGIDLF